MCQAMALSFSKKALLCYLLHFIIVRYNLNTAQDSACKVMYDDVPTYTEIRVTLRVINKY